MASYRARLAAEIESAWRWLEGWGHSVTRLDLDRLSISLLQDVHAEERLRVAVLAATWERWW